MGEIEETIVLISDLENIHNVLAMCFTFSTASDIVRNQQLMVAGKQSPLTVAIEDAKERVDGIIGDWLFEQRRIQREAGLLDSPDEIEEEALEELSPNPLGKIQFPRQEGTRIDSRGEDED